MLEGMGLKAHDGFANRKDAPALARRLLAYCAMQSTFQTR
jgi:hypothetical protein